MEKALNRGEVQPDDSADAQPSDRLEIAHVLFMDLVAFSTLPMEEQRQGVRKLQEIVLASPQVREGERSGSLIRLPTGDGMALVFFGDPMACVECAWGVSSELKQSHLKLRMGINTGPVYRVADINAKLNASGGGINMAERIMDAGDAGHILVSKSTAEILQQLKTWAPYLHDLGVHPVKHGVKLQFFNLYNSENGNPTLPSRFRQRSTARLRLRLTIAIAFALAATLAFYATKQTRVKRKSSVAVMGFRNITARPDVDWVSTDLADGLRTELASTGKVRTISGEESAEMWKDLGLTRLDSMGKASLGRLHNRGADIVIVGSYTDLQGGKIHVDIDIQDTAAGETVNSLAADGTEAEISQLVAETGQRLRTKMGLGQISAEKERQVALSQPSPEAAPAYSDGLAKLRAYEPMQARSFLERAIISDSAFPYAHAALAEAWFMLGYDRDAKEQAKKAFELSTNLSFEDRTSIEGRYRGIASDWPAAMAAYQRLYDYSPQNLDYGLKLAEAQRSAGKGQDALRTLGALRKLAQPEGNDPRIDLEEAETAESLGDLRRGLTMAANAAKTAKGTGARLLESRSLHWSCAAYRRLGQMDQAKQACEEARKIAMELGDNLDTARALNDLANIRTDQGDLDGARQLFEQALALGRQIGDQRDVSGALNNIGFVLSGQGRLAEAKPSYEEALKIQREIGFKTEIPNTLENLGDLLHQEGDLAGARRTFEEGIAAARESGNDVAQAGSKANLATVLLDQGDLREGEQNCRQALAMERKLGAKSDLGSTLDILADVLLARGNLHEAEQSYREALSLQQGLGEKGTAAMSKIGLATVLLENGDAPGAETMVRPVVEELHSEKDSPDEAAARVLLVRALLVQKKLPEAQKEMDQAIALVMDASQRNVRYNALTTAARLNAAVGGKSNLARAKESLQQIARDAGKAGMPGFELEARLATGQIELAQGDSSRGRSLLSVVQKDAEARGFLLIAHKAGR